jgi:CheY-like chemotaxis protein
MDSTSKVKVLCVDDEPNVLSGLSLHLRRRYDLLTATSGAAGLEELLKNPTTAVIISDMRMPAMDGATFLSRSREVVPDAVRLLLTGQTDVTAAVAAINHGQIFRFLTKPCPPAALVAAVEAALEQHRLVTAERTLLQQTLRGSIKALTDVLALANPVAFGCALRIRQHVIDLMAPLGMTECWQLDVAAMLCQLGSVTLPPETVGRLYYGKALTDDDAQMVGRMPAVTEQLLGNIPRLDDVLSILSAVHKPFRVLDSNTADARDVLVHRAGELLKAAVDFDALEAKGDAPARALDIMRARSGRYDPDVLNALHDLRAVGAERERVMEIPVAAIRAGMVFAEDLKAPGGMLLAARGCEVTAGFLERVRNGGIATDKVKVIASRAEMKVAS